MVAVKKDHNTGEAIGTGRRKSSVARVRIKPGKGNIQVNGQPFDKYFTTVKDQRALLDTLEAVGSRESLDVTVSVSGGGNTGQSGACKMGIARALISHDSAYFQVLRDGGFLTRDSRMKERKKYGLHGARRGTQFSKR
jgi:small subunit ribosomal protein S9